VGQTPASGPAHAKTGADEGVGRSPGDFPTLRIFFNKFQRIGSIPAALIAGAAA
jgi:hypothetical protein